VTTNQTHDADIVPIDQSAEKRYNDSELKEFLLVIRRALLLVVRWIERKYDVG
jgi:hypothetical protein